MPFWGQKEYLVWLVYRVVVRREIREARLDQGWIRQDKSRPPPVRAPWHMNFSVRITVSVAYYYFRHEFWHAATPARTRGHICLLRKARCPYQYQSLARTLELLYRIWAGSDSLQITTRLQLDHQAKARNNMGSILLTAPSTTSTGCSCPLHFSYMQAPRLLTSQIFCRSHVESGQSRLRPRRHSA